MVKGFVEEGGELELERLVEGIEQL
jgi:hypothetical protein